MVQQPDLGQDWPGMRNLHPPRGQHWQQPFPQQQRHYFEQTPGGMRFGEEPTDVKRPISIEKALRDHCQIPARAFFMAAVLDDGKTTTFTGGPAGGVPLSAVGKFFNMEKYTRYVSKTETAANNPFDELHDRRSRNPTLEVFDDGAFTTRRKRPRGNLYHRDADADDDTPAPVTSSKRAIKIGNSQEVWDFYGQRFRNCQQTACKVIAKAWVKAVEPKKQSTHPYTGSDEKAPDWWPKPWGTSKDERVRHKEPDHLYKHERVHLLIHILKMIVEPVHSQHPDIQKLRLSVAKLEEITNESLSTFFADKQNPNNAKKRPFLREIFKVARLEERYKNGEVDEETVIYVMADDRIPENYASENEDAGSATKDEQDVETTMPPPSMTPQKLAAPTFAENPDSGQPASVHGGSYIGELPVRGPQQFSQQMVGSDIGQEQHPYVEGVVSSLHQPASMGMHEIYQSPHDSSRRSSMFAPSDYTSPQTPSIYQSWQPGSTAPPSSTMYSFPQQQQGPHSFVPHNSAAIAQNGAAMNHNQQYMGSAFDGLARGGHDSSHNAIFRSNIGDQGSLGHPHGYTGYDPSSSIPVSSVKAESLNRNPLS